MIDIRNLTYTVEGKNLLNHITDTWQTGTTIGIIGPNGSGKTTLLRHVYGDMKSNGSIYIDGIDNDTISRKQRAQLMAIVAQHGGDIEGLLTVGQVVRMGRYPYRHTERSDDDDTVVASVMSRLGIDDLGHRAIHQLSGGELQRTLIGRAFAQETEYIFLDEPTNHLDIQYKLGLMEQLKVYNGTVILTLHDLILAGRYCDYIVAMKDSQIAYTGTVEEVCTSERLSEVFSVPMEVGKTEQGFIVTY